MGGARWAIGEALLIGWNSSGLHSSQHGRGRGQVGRGGSAGRGGQAGRGAMPSTYSPANTSMPVKRSREPKVKVQMQHLHMTTENQEMVRDMLKSLHGDDHSIPSWVFHWQDFFAANLDLKFTSGLGLGVQKTPCFSISVAYWFLNFPQNNQYFRCVALALVQYVMFSLAQ